MLEDYAGCGEFHLRSRRQHIATQRSESATSETLFAPQRLFIAARSYRRQRGLARNVCDPIETCPVTLNASEFVSVFSTIEVPAANTAIATDRFLRFANRRNEV
jgi:hypothetical protein